MSRTEVSLRFQWQLAVKSEGTFEVPAFQTAVSGSRVSVPAARVEVSKKAPAQRRNNNRRRRSPFEREPAIQEVPQHLELRTEVSASRPWMGQEIIVTDVLEFEGQVQNFDADLPQFPGFAKHEIPIERRPRGVLGKTWNEVPLARWNLVALGFGDQTLPSRGYTLHVNTRSRSLFDFGRSTRKHRRETQALPLEVRPLPPGAPASFGGAVGDFHLSASLLDGRLDAGDGTTLLLTLRGSGSFEELVPPEIKVPDGLKIFEPEVHVETRPDHDGYTTGTKLYRYPLLATVAGEHVIEPVEWTYFLPRTGRYVTRKSSQLWLEVAESDAPDFIPQRPPGTREEVDPVGQDIHHVRAAWTPDRSVRRRHEALPAGWWQLLALGPAMNVLVLGLLAFRRFSSDDPGRRRAKQARGQADQRLDEARSELAAGRSREAVEMASRAVSGLVLDRLGEDRGEPSPADIARLLDAHDGGELTGRVKGLLDEADFARFSSAGAADASSLLQRAQDLVAVIDDVLPERKKAS